MIVVVVVVTMMMIMTMLIIIMIIIIIIIIIMILLLLLLLLLIIIIIIIIIITTLKRAVQDFENLTAPRTVRTPTRPGHNCEQTTCNTWDAYHVQQVCHGVRRDSSATDTDSC